MPELKSPLSYNEQLIKLSAEHDLVINSTSEALEILKKVNYYRLSGYGLGLKQKDNPEKYTQNISFETLYRLYTFDSSFKNILIHAIEQIEIQLRTQISYHLAHTYGSKAHLNPNNFIPKENNKGNQIYSLIIGNLNKEIERQSKAPFVKHHLNTYDLTVELD